MIDSMAFIEGLKEQRASGAYLLAGEDDFCRNRVLRAIEESVLTEENAWNLSIHQADELDAGAMVTEALSIPFFGTRRVIVLRAIEKLKSDLEEAVVELIRNLPDFCVFVIIGNPDRRRRVWREMDRLGRIISCEPMKAEQLPAWIVSRAREMGYHITPKAVRILSTLSVDRERLSTELEKLASYVGEANRITEKDVVEVVSSDSFELPEYAIFDFVDCLASGRTTQSLRLLKRLLDTGREPVVVLSMIVRQLRMILWASGIRASGGRVEDAEKELGVRSFVARKAWKQAASLKQADVIVAMWYCLQADRALKTGKDGRFVLERLVVSINEKRPLRA